MPYKKNQRVLTQQELNALSWNEMASLVAENMSIERGKALYLEAIKAGKIPEIKDPVELATVTYGRVVLEGYEKAAIGPTRSGGSTKSSISVAGVVPAGVTIAGLPLAVAPKPTVPPVIEAPKAEELKVEETPKVEELKVEPKKEETPKVEELKVEPKKEEAGVGSSVTKTTLRVPAKKTA